MTRKAINKKIKANEDKVKALKIENRNLFLQSLEITDKFQQYSESEQEIGRGKNKRKVIMGKITWNEYFKDEDTGKLISLQRNQYVKQDGIWLV